MVRAICRFRVAGRQRISEQMIRYRSYLGVFLALLLALTGQSMAVARGTPNAAGQIVMCTGTGPTVVSVDDTGQPVGPPYICPDFATSLFAATYLPPAVPVRPLTRALVLPLPARTLVVSLKAPSASARGPPDQA